MAKRIQLTKHPYPHWRLKGWLDALSDRGEGMPLSTMRAISDLLHEIDRTRKEGHEDICEMLESWDRQVDHFWRLSDCIRFKFNRLSKRQLRKNPRYKGVTLAQYREKLAYERENDG